MCGISLVVGDKSAASLCVAVLQRLQHRGHQAAKVVAEHNGKLFEKGGLGRIDEIFKGETLLTFNGTWAVGQTRYTTSGDTNEVNVQPFHADTSSGYMIMAHNGQFGTPIDIEKKKKEVMKKGFSLTHTSDSELFLANFCLSQKNDVVGKLKEAFRQSQGSAAIVGMIGRTAFAGRKRGNRPLFVAETGEGGFAFASEDYMLKNFDLQNVREVPPGTLMLVKDGELEEHKIWDAPVDSRFCIFELFYFSHPLTTYHDVTISLIRKGFGKKLAQEHPVDADVVTAVPDSGNHAALGYSMESGIPFDLSIIRNHYTGRTFIGSADKRVSKSRQKYDVDPSSVAGKRVVVVDDSLVRSTTARSIVEKLRKAGAKEIHLLMASPPIKYPNYYGIDMKSKEELIASRLSIEEIRDELGIKYLGYLSLAGAYEVIGTLTGDTIKRGDFCDACFTGDYWDVTLPEELGKGKSSENQDQQTSHDRLMEAVQ